MDTTLPPDVWDWFPERTFAAGDVVTCGERWPDCLFVLVEGRVRVELADHAVAIVHEQGSVLGAIGPLRAPELHGRIVAETDVVVREVDDFLTLCDADPAVAVVIAHTVATRLDELHGLVLAELAELG